MSKNKSVYGIFVEGVDDSDVWYEVAKYKGLHNQFYFISGGGTNLEQNYIDVSYLINNVKGTTDVEYFCLVDYDEQGLEYCRALKQHNHNNNTKIKCWTLKSIVNPNDYNDTCDIEDLLWNQNIEDYVSKRDFLDDYSQHPNNYPVINYAWKQLVNIIKCNSKNNCNDNEPFIY